MTTPSHLRTRALPTLAGLILLLLLAACGGPERVRFDSDPRILRGSWRGTVPDDTAAGRDESLQLDLDAVYLDRWEYDFGGTMSLAGQGGFTVEGRVGGGTTEEYIHTQTPAELPPGFDANIRNAEGEVAFRLCGMRLLDDASYWVSLEPATEPLDLVGSMFSCTEQGGYQFVLARPAE